MPGFVSRKIAPRRSFSAVLRSARHRLDITLETAEAVTKIPQKYLQALENDDFGRLPAEAYNVGYVRRYAEYLRLNPEDLVVLYRVQRSTKWHQTAPAAVSFQPKKVSDWHFLITPKLVGIASMVLLFGGLSAYIFGQLRQFTNPPPLSIFSVPAELTSSQDQVVLTGKTGEGATVTINSEPIFVSPDGSFSQPVQLSPGLNEIVVQAKSRAERTTQQSVKVLFNPDLASLD